MNKRTLARFVQRWPLPLRLSQVIWRRIVPPWMTAGAVGAVYNSAGKLLIVEHVLHPKYPWGLPGGWMNRNEDPSHTVARELREETGLEVTVERPLLITSTSDLRHHLDLGFLCRAETETITLSAELLDYRWVAPNADDMPPLMRFHAEVLQAAVIALNAERKLVEV
jgi:8-oxo-dGTP diphosphatase